MANTPTKEFHSCKCFAAPTGQTYGIEGEETDEPIYGPCGGTTRRVFAPGHDAKLKGILIEAYLEDREVHQDDGGSLISTDPMARAASLSWEHFLRNAKALQQAKIGKRIKRQQARQDKAAMKKATTVKVGRWEYALLSITNEDVNSVGVTYRDKKGNTKAANVKRSALVY